MGKTEEDEFSLSSTEAAQAASLASEIARRGERKCWVRLSRLFGLKCVLVLLLGISVFLSAVFWLPPFFDSSDHADKDLDPRFRGHTIVASFRLKKPVAFVRENSLQLATDLYYDFEPANGKVVIISLESSGLNTTDVVFAIDSISKHSSISLAQLSLIRSNFESLVAKQLDLRLTTALFGNSSLFEVLKFPGGITVSPPQHVYPLQKVQISFNFTLNNSILQIQENFLVLINQLKSGIHLTDRENLYIHLTNKQGSTVDPPATIQTSVVLMVGVPSVPRVKQLAKTIRDSPARNLGLNNTVFGKVKQVSLSSVLTASIPGSPTPAPAPGPLPHHHHRHHHHHHHHHHHNHGASFPPVTAPSYPPVGAHQPVEGSPAPEKSAPTPVKGYKRLPPTAPAPAKSYQASPQSTPAPVKSHHAIPSGCRFRHKGRHPVKSPERSRTGVARAPSMSRYHPAPPSHGQAEPPSPVLPRISPSSPLPYVIYAHAHPPPSGSDPEPPDKMPSVAPLTSSGGNIVPAHWIRSLLVAFLLVECAILL